MRPPHPAFNVRDDRETPLIERGTRSGNTDFEKSESGMFLCRRLDRWNRVDALAKSTFSTQTVFVLW
jgi:hypothetical protein